jgi:ubiquinone/menaquinone biosynthesis C-methylase UbiE
MNTLLYQRFYDLEKENWWFKARRKILLSFIEEQYKQNQEKRLKILDLGCGTGIMLGHLALYGQVSGIDNSKEAIKFCHRRNFQNVTLADAQKLPLKSNSFDIVTALDLLEHVKDDQKALKEMKRILRPDGYALITLPAFPSLWSSHDLFNKHYRRYTKKDILNKVKRAGLKIKRLTFFNTFLFLPSYVFRFSTGFLNRSGFLKAHTDLWGMPKFINQSLHLIFALEKPFLKYLNFPIGITLLLELNKPKAS